MPGKKKGGKKKKAGASKKISDKESVASAEPIDDKSFLKDGTNSKPTSGKKKKSKKKKASKLSLSEKVLLKLEKGVDLLKGNRYAFEHFVECMDEWLKKRGKQVVEFLQTYDATGDGVVLYDEFKSILFDMNCPFSQIEIHLLCKTLDNDNTGDIEYSELSKGLRQFIKENLVKENEVGEDGEGSEDEIDEVTLVRGQSARDINKCRSCKIGLWSPGLADIEYIELTMLLITFADSMKKHPCHFTKVVHNDISVYGLIQLIKSEVGIQSTTITVFRDKSHSDEARLDENLTLADCGLDGRDWYNPIEHVLYYDYTSEFGECPILMADHYFINRKTTVLPR